MSLRIDGTSFENGKTGSNCQTLNGFWLLAQAA
jgi:hypothetical protein